MNNKWKEIWEKRKADFHGIGWQDQRAMLLELKRIDGFDVEGDAIPYEELAAQYTRTRDGLGSRQKMGGWRAYLKSDAAQGQIFTSSRRMALRLVAWIIPLRWSISADMSFREGTTP